MYDEEKKRMVEIYLMERTWEGSSPLLSPSWITKPRPKLSVLHIDTHVANSRFDLAEGSHSRLDHSPESESESLDSPVSPDEDFTPCPSPTTAFTTPATSPLREAEAWFRAKLDELTRDVAQLKASNAAAESKIDNLRESVNVWKERYMDGVIHSRKLEEEIHQKKGG